MSLIRFLPIVFFFLFIVVSCGAPAPKTGTLPPALSDSATLVHQHGKTVTVTGTWVRPELDDATSRLVLSDGTCLLFWYCSYDDTLSAMLLHTAESHLLGQKVRVTGRYLFDMPDTCGIKSRINMPARGIGYIDRLKAIEADSSNAI